MGQELTSAFLGDDAAVLASRHRAGVASRELLISTRPSTAPASQARARSSGARKRTRTWPKEALAPHVITNGRNLWVHWRRIDKDALVVVVDVKLPYPGGSTAYYDAVGRCNVLIAKAIQDAGAELCLPTSRRVDIKKDPQAPKGP